MFTKKAMAHTFTKFSGLNCRGHQGLAFRKILGNSEERILRGHGEKKSEPHISPLGEMGHWNFCLDRAT